MKRFVLFFFVLIVVVVNISARSSYQRAYNNAKETASKPKIDVKKENVEFIVGDTLQRYGIVCSIYSNVKYALKDRYDIVSKYAPKAAVVKRKNGDYIVIAMNSDNLDDLSKLKKELPSKYRRGSWIIDFEGVIMNRTTAIPSNTPPKHERKPSVNPVL